MGADVIELLLPPSAVKFEESAPSLAVGMAVLFGVEVIEVSLFDGGELVGFDGWVGCDVLKELAAAAPTPASLPLALLANSPYNEMSSWPRRLDGSGVIIAWMRADREGC